MARRIKTKGQKQPRIRSTSRGAEKVDAQALSDELSARCTNESTDKSRSGAPASIALRQDVAARLSRSEEAPTSKTTLRNRTIPLSDEDWRKLECLAQDKETAATPGQVGGGLLHQALKSIEEE